MLCPRDMGLLTWVGTTAGTEVSTRQGLHLALAPPTCDLHAEAFCMSQVFRVAAVLNSLCVIPSQDS